MFSVNKPEYVNKTFRLPVELVQKLEGVAQREEVSVNYLVVQCCEYALDNHAPAENLSVKKPKKK